MRNFGKKSPGFFRNKNSRQKMEILNLAADLAKVPPEQAGTKQGVFYGVRALSEGAIRQSCRQEAGNAQSLDPRRAIAA
jgi:hypothetical protein